MTFSKKIILASIALSFICFSYLAYSENQQQDYNYGKSWWTTYFVDPKGEDLSFVVENHSSETAFHWEISLDKAIVAKGDVKLNVGEKKTVPVKASDNNGKTVLIKISTPKGSKEIYKKF